MKKSLSALPCRAAAFFRRYRLAYSLIAAFLATFALEFSLYYPIAPQDGKQLLWVILFAGCAALIYRSLQAEDTRQDGAATVLGLVFSVFFVTARCLARSETLVEYFQSALGVFHFVFGVLGMAALFRALLLLLLQFVLSRDFSAQDSPKTRRWRGDTRSAFLLLWGLIFLCWLPYFFSAYPGILSVDSVNQLRMYAGAPLTNHHPLLHTALISLFAALGDAVGNRTFGVALYSLAQMSILAAVFSYCLRYMARLSVPLFWRVGSLAYFALFPINSLYSVTMWKDILFGAASLMLCIQLFELLREPKKTLHSPRFLVSFTLLLLVFALMRNNGYYALLPFMPLMLLVLRRRVTRRALLSLGLCFITVILMVRVYHGPVFRTLEVQEGSVGEALSVPLQQIARTVKLHGNELSAQELAEINRFLPADELPALYKSHISDPIKARLDTAEFDRDKSGFIKLWLGLLTRFPGCYVDSFLYGSYGYWSTDVHYWIYAVGLRSNDLGVARPESMGAAQRFGWVERVLVSTPLLSMLFSIGFYVWLLLIAAALLLLKRRGTLLLPLALLAFLWLTVAASPVFGEYRYAYGIIVCAPLFLGVALVAEKFPDSKNEKMK